MQQQALMQQRLLQQQQQLIAIQQQPHLSDMEKSQLIHKLMQVIFDKNGVSTSLFLAKIKPPYYHFGP